MKQDNLLKSFDYSIPCKQGDNDGLSDLVQVNIDFERRNITLDGLRQFITSPGRRREWIKTKASKKKVSVRASICPGPGLDLSESMDNDFAFSLEGVIDDGKSLHSCAGLLLVNGTARTNGAGYREWQLAVYLYDEHNTERQIDLKLTMYSVFINADLN